MNCINRIGIDEDVQDRKEAYRKFEYSKSIVKAYGGGTIELLKSRRGFHIHLHLNHAVSLIDDLAIRYILKDSPGRLWLEERRLRLSKKYGLFQDTFDLMSNVKMSRDGHLSSEDLLLSVDV